MSTVPEREDDGSVDVEAVWADIVAHWDDATVVPPGQGEAPPSPRGPDAPNAPNASTAPPAPSAASARPATDADADEPPVVERADQRARPEPAVDDDWGVVTSRVGGQRAQDAADRDARTDAEVEDEGYTPPEPPPLPRGDLVGRLAWAGVLGAPVFFVLAALFWHSAPTWLVVAAVAAFVAGFVTLVLRMPEHRDPDDDGAVV